LSEEDIQKQCETLNVNYFEAAPKLSLSAKNLYYIFSLLNRRRIEHRPLQKNDILDEIEGTEYQDKQLSVIENLDSYWLSKEAERIKNRTK